MRYRHDQRPAPTIMGFNATPMVDVFFLLTIFFMLVARFSSAEQVPMELPNPEGSQARITRMPERVVINCRPADPSEPYSGPVRYSIGPNKPESLDVISDRLAAFKRDTPQIRVVVRADRRLPYAPVRALMGVVARNGIEMLNVVAHVGEDE